MALTSSHEEIGKDSGRIAEIKPVIDIYNLEEINYPSDKMTEKKKEKNYSDCSQYLYTKNTYPAYVSKHN